MSLEKDFLIFIKNYENLILKVASIYCRMEEERKDLMQEIIIQLWRSFPKYNSDVSAMSTWTYRIALNVSISYVRKTTSRNKALLKYKENIDLIQIGEDDMEDKLKRLYDSIQFLKPFDKAVISLHLEGCKHKEIAEILGITPSNVSTRLARIKQQLKNKLIHTTK